MHFFPDVLFMILLLAGWLLVMRIFVMIVIVRFGLDFHSSFI